LLVKGPIAAVFVLAPIAAWALAFGHVAAVWRRYAWVKGALLALAIAAPWYAAAELRNPGFLRYFIVGEHLSRFLVPGWNGDLYGRAHDAPRGTVLLFFVVGLLPWSLALIPAFRRERTVLGARWREQRDLVAFWLLAAAAPLALFALAGNVIFPYALPAVPAAAIALAALLEGRAPVSSPRPRFELGAAATVAALAAAAVAALPSFTAHSQRAVVASSAAAHGTSAVPLYYWQQRFFSADYYSHGRVRVLRDAAQLERLLDVREPFALAVPADERSSLPTALAARLHAVDEVNAVALLEPSDGPSEGGS
jgi:4-amino-4-deoxy-L-arabinose transferase-like glycosyltransferase